MRLPLTLTRRIGEACEAAQKFPVLRQSVIEAAWVTLMVRLEMERQKLFKAMQWSAVMHRL